MNNVSDMRVGGSSFHMNAIPAAVKLFDGLDPDSDYAHGVIDAIALTFLPWKSMEDGRRLVLSFIDLERDLNSM